jgi:hypothetical protein
MTSTDATADVLPFEPRPKAEREFLYCEVRLDDPSGDIELTLVDEIGSRVVFGYLLVAAPEGFDKATLVEAWGKWRGSSGRAY